MTQLQGAQYTAHVSLKVLITALSEQFVERKNVISGILTAMLAGEHVLLLGPPGTAKTEMTRAIAESVFGKGCMFAVLASKFSTPDEFYGPIDIQAYKQGVQRRIVTRRAWDSQCVFVDEIFKASSAILNTLLKTMQERVADNGGEVPVPLKVLVGASNEYPEGDSLKALYDRFCVKFWVEYVSDRNSFGRVLGRGGVDHTAIPSLKTEDWETLVGAVDDVEMTTSDIEIMLNVKAALEAEGFRPSDRMWIKACKMVRARAVLNGRCVIQPEDFRILPEMLWADHKDRSKIIPIIGGAADPYGSRAIAIQDGVKIALRELPDITTLKSGRKRKTEFLSELAKVFSMISAENDRAMALFDESHDNQTVIDICNEVKSALTTVTELQREATFHREVRKS